MRILVASHTYIVDLNCEKFRILASLEADIEVTIVVPRYWRPGGVQTDLVRKTPWQSGRLRIVPIANCSRNHQGLLTFGPALIQLLRMFRPHIIQVEQGTKSLAYAELITLNRLLGLRAKKVLFTWWNLPYQLTFPMTWLEQYNLRNTDGAIAGNQDGANILRNHGYAGPLRVMPQLGVDEIRFRPQPQPQLANRLGLQPDEFVVGFVGRFVEEKGLPTLMRALHQLKDDEHSWRCLLLGQGPLQAELQQQAVALGVSDRLLWVESVSHAEVPQYINLLSALVLPSETTSCFKTFTSVGWKEQFGHVLVEAMACRVPIVGSDSGEIPHVVGDAGLIFPEGNAAALAQHLRSLMAAPEKRIALSKRGYNRVLQQYTNRALAKQTLNFYQELLA